MGTLNVDKLDPESGTALEIGTSGDTVTVPSGVTLTTTNATVNLPASVGGLGTGIDVTSQITGVVPTANLGSGSASSSTVLYGDQTYKAEPTSDFVKLLSTSASASASIAIDGYFTTDYDRYMLFLGGCFFSAHNDSVFSLRYNYGGAALTGSNYVNMFESHQKVSGSISERQLSEWNNDKISLGYCSNAVTHPAVFQCTIWDPLNTTSYKLITTNGVGYGTTSGISVGGGCCAWIVDTNPISGITLYSENGADVTVSKIVLYGLKD